MKPFLTINTILEASQDQVSADLTADSSTAVVILGLKDGKYFELNEVGARVWQLIQQPRSLQSVLDALMEEYEVTADQCQNDLMILTSDLISKGLVVVKDE